MAKKHGKQADKREDLEIDVSSILSLILDHCDEELCESVFQDVRGRERQRDWSLACLARFWLSVVLEAPPGLSHLLERSRAGDGTGLLPAVAATRSAFSQRCQSLPSAFFEILYSRFVDRLLADRTPQYARKLERLAGHLSGVVVVDGSRLDKIAHKLKILRNEKAAVLPGCLTAVYDLSHGVATQLWFDADAAASEHTRAVKVFETFPERTLVLGDRLYCSLALFEVLDRVKCFGVFRRNATVTVRSLQTLSEIQLEDGAVIKDELVEAGTGARMRTLRRVTLEGRGTPRSALTNALDPTVLSAMEVVDLYPRRWQIERLFFDLKEVLDLKRLYASHPNAVAMQVFATAMVHAAFRVAQGQIAEEAKIEPERLSPAKLFPRLALACLSLVEFEYCFRETQKANRKVKLNKPSPSAARNQKIRLSWILVEHRNPNRRKKKFSKERATWKSLKKIRGGRKLT